MGGSLGGREERGKEGLMPVLVVAVVMVAVVREGK